MPPEEAKAIVAMAGHKARAKATASKAVLSAVRELMHEETRDRSGFLQADIPSQLKNEIASIAKEKDTTVTSLVFDKLAHWIDPKTGERRITKTKGGGTSRIGPKNLRSYVLATKVLYSQASKDRSMARLQVEVGPKISRYLRGILSPSRIPMSRFLTALAHDIINQNRLANVEEFDMKKH